MGACNIHRVHEVGCVDCLQDQRDNLQAEVNNLRATLKIAGLEPQGEKCVRCSWVDDKVLKECWPCAEIRRLGGEVAELQKKLAQIKTAICAGCGGSGEIGLADDDIVCPDCYGSGDPTKPGVWAPNKAAPVAPSNIEHCYVGGHCNYFTERRCICVCAKCKDARARDH